MEQYWKRETDIGGLGQVLNKYKEVFPPDGMRAFFTSNHDENSHSGSEYERMGDAAKAFAVLCATWDGLPLIYSGQELPNRKRLKFFDKDVIDWGNSCALHDFYKTLLHLRSRSSALIANDGVASAQTITTTDGRIFSFLRKNADSEVLVILNLSADVVSFTFTDEHLSGNYREIFSGTINNIGATSQFNLNGWDYKVYEK
jgi:glycosidase